MDSLSDGLWGLNRDWVWSTADESHGDARGCGVWQGSTHSFPPSLACPWSTPRAGASGRVQEAQGQGIQLGQCYTSSS